MEEKEKRAAITSMGVIEIKTKVRIVKGVVRAANADTGEWEGEKV